MHGVIFTIGSLFFITLLMIIYFAKERFLSIRNKLYRYMLIDNVILLLTQIFAVILVSFNQSEMISNCLFRIHWFAGVIWLSLLYFYSNCFLKNIDSDSLFSLIKSNIIYIVMSIIFLIIMIIYFFIPFANLTNPNNISYVPGNAALFVLSFCVSIAVILAVIVILNRKNIIFRNRLSVVIMIIEMIIILVMQLLFEHVAFLPLAITLQMFFLYFIVENPDLVLISELGTTKDEIERSSRAKSDFLSNMSHEIRTPMNAIIGFSEAVLDRKKFSSKEVKQDIENISTASNNLIEIINNILDISKIESGKEVLDEREYSLKKMVLDLTDITKQRLRGKSINLILNVDEKIPDRLYGDYTKLYQILLNLLTNAVKYTEVGKIVLTIKGEMGLKDVKLSFEVRDTGYGIKKEDYDKLFSKFNRLHIATDKEIEGTGLGLVITKQYVELLGGTISFDSDYEVGTTFYVSLKQKVVDKEKIGVLEKDKIDKDNNNYIDCSKYNVLIVDDNSLNIKVAEKLLSAYKFNISSVNSGKECIYKIKEGNHYDIIFMDIMMPEMDGVETLHIVKKLEDFDIPPIVALTANAITGMKEFYLNEGFDGYLAKPINIKELNKLIKEYFER